MAHIFEVMRYCFNQWFHKRKIIIVSEHKVKHLSVGGKTQFCILMLMAGSLCWASYSTGGFMAARSLVKERTQALRAVTRARVTSDFTTLLQISPMAVAAKEGAPIGKGPVIVPSDTSVRMPSVLANDNLFSRIAFLEHKISELQQTNDSIIQRVQAKAAGNIENLESVIRQTGLDPEELKKQAEGNKSGKPDDADSDASAKPAEGGPYIPAGPINMPPQAEAMFNSLDQLATLKTIVNDLPLGMPIDSPRQDSPFGQRIDPFTGAVAFHPGLDLAGPYGAEIYAAADGKVVSAGPNGPYGNAVDIDHGFGIVTRYGHMSKVLVHDGDTVHKGDVVGLEGSTGRSTGPHLHYEVRYNDEPINPKKFLTVGERYVSKEQE